VAPPSGRILTVNAGSSSLKLRILDAQNRVVSSRDSGSVQGQEELKNELAAILAEGGTVDAAGHRVVHGGPEHDGPAVLDASVEEELDRLADLAPLHNPPALEAIRALEAELPGLPNVACFDTAFHADIPAAASTYAVPAAWSARWPLRRYGFHGLSHAYASRRAAELLGRPQAELRLVTAHLGAGASLAAVQGGRSVDTTMGFTPLDGLVMATRSGSVDPGLLLWVQRHGEIGAEEMERALDRESGLLGLSGHSGDMRKVIAAADDGDERSRLAFDVYIHRLAAAIASMAAAMGGIDALVFTGGVGENSARVRSAAADAVTFLGVELNSQLNDNAKTDGLLSAVGATAPAVLIQAREDIEIAAQVRAALRLKE
jgi:acetate kinase